ncbi:hypothetical protein V492_04274 [Pseudogymnoascus sp. VKM F-4246]|nr:hypothetical protein V492_04274 [Pseudogymnoascus sp. VKM F-4246]
MLSSLQPARLSVVALLLASFVLSKDAHKASSIVKAGAPLVAAKYHVVDELHIRQDNSDDSGSGGLADLFPTSDAETTDSEPTSTDAPPSSTEDSQSESSTEPPSSTTSDDPTTTPSDTGATTTPSKTSTDESSKTTDESTKPTKSSDTTTSKPTTSSPPRSTITFKHTTTADVTSDGKTYQTTYVATSLIPTNTASPIDDTPEKKDGMSSQTKKTVIGVVVGIGGAIFVALIFIVFWKFWGRRRSARRAQEDDALMMTSPGEKGETSSTTNPFQSTLESYHAPQRPVNASSNF